MDMQKELSAFSPDSSEIYEQQWEERYGKDKDKNKKKVFGRDIFNKKNLSFEPNMKHRKHLKNYRLGPGDAVYIEIYGASQKNHRRYCLTRRKR
jgi:hypothetical protein